ncbi:hypothetical protein K0B04_01020 [Patescibacteria group bacterium]|nr:hypothetical protein [Patescibacteria group bacterium]
MKNNELPEFTEEQIKETESRIISDADLIKGGAEIKKDGRLEITRKQYESALEEMEKEIDDSKWLQVINVNGIDYYLGLEKNILVYSDSDPMKPDELWLDKPYVICVPGLLCSKDFMDIDVLSDKLDLLGFQEEGFPGIPVFWILNAGSGREEAEEVFDYMVNLAEVGDDRFDIYSKTVKFILDRVPEEEKKSQIEKYGEKSIFYKEANV